MCQRCGGNSQAFFLIYQARAVRGAQSAVQVFISIKRASHYPSQPLLLLLLLLLLLPIHRRHFNDPSPFLARRGGFAPAVPA